jgi:hypothetical protein
VDPTAEQILQVIRLLDVRVTRVAGCLVNMYQEPGGRITPWRAPPEKLVLDWLAKCEGDRRAAELMINHRHLDHLFDPWSQRLPIRQEDLMEVARAYVAMLRQALIEFCGEGGFEIVVSGEEEAKQFPDELEVSSCSWQ